MYTKKDLKFIFGCGDLDTKHDFRGRIMDLAKEKHIVVVQRTLYGVTIQTQVAEVIGSGLRPTPDFDNVLNYYEYEEVYLESCIDAMVHVLNNPNTTWTYDE